MSWTWKLWTQSQKVNRFENKINSLKKTVAEQISQGDKSNQYSRPNCLRITGIQEVTGESADNIVMDIIKAIGAEVILDPR